MVKAVAEYSTASTGENWEMCKKVGSAEWLLNNAWFACEHCEESSEPTVHRASNLRMWNGLTICDDCWSGYVDSPMPERWTELDSFEPFECLKVAAE